jgi:type VI secretion system secreted protein VgrG
MFNQSTIKAQTPYDMSKKPPAPIMSRNNPRRPTRGVPRGSRITDVVIVKDGTKPPTQDNIKRVIEVKFPPTPPMSREQKKAYDKIAGPAARPVEEWTPNTCGCEGKKKRVPVPAPGRAEDAAAIAILMLLILALILDDVVGGEGDDVLIPALVRRLMEKLATSPTPVPVPGF